MPGLGGLETLVQIHARHRLLPVIILTADTAVDSVVKAMREGAYDYLVKPVDLTALTTRIRNAVERSSMSVRLLELERELDQDGYPGFVGNSAPMKTLFRRMDRLAASDVTVLIHGESGTGKELVARAIHQESGRRGGAFVALNCAAIPESLQESELFGHEKGAFTGAAEQRKGRFEQADQGTLLLDEIGELSLSLQAKLLRVIQERSFQRIGGSAEIRSDFRLLAATHRDLRKEVEAGKFREDLYFRVAVVELEVPPLRERNDDVRLLAEYFLAELNRQNGSELSLSPDTLDAFASYRWPGNVRELKNVLQRAVVFSENDLINPEDLPEEIRKAPFTPPPDSGRKRNSLAAPRGRAFGEHTNDGDVPRDVPLDSLNLEVSERITISRALEATGGNVPEASRRLGISKPTLYRKLKKYGLR